MDLTSFGFEANYSVKRLDGRPQGNVHEFRQPRLPVAEGDLVLETGPEYLWIEVTPVDGEPWVGGFECGPGRRTGLYATPSPDTICIIARGQGFWVPVLAPVDCEIIRSIPIQEICPVPGKRMLVFVDFTGLEAYGPDGFCWQTERLSWDGLTITDVTAEKIRGTAWDSPADREVSFSVNTENGASEGGSSPAKYREVWGQV